MPLTINSFLENGNSASINNKTMFRDHFLFNAQSKYLKTFPKNMNS
jgi:hypothetical protein